MLNLNPQHNLFSAESEAAVLGSLINNARLTESNAIAFDGLSFDDFYFEKNRLIMASIVHLNGKGDSFDLVNLNQHIDELGQSNQIGGFGYLGEIAKSSPRIFSDGHVKRIQSYSSARKLHKGYIDALNILNGSGMISQRVSDSIAAVAGVGIESENEGRLKHIKDQMGEYVDHAEKVFQSDSALTGISTGFADLDQRSGGAQDGDLIVIGGLPSMGKTTFAMNILESMAIHEKKHILFFSLEMPDILIRHKLISSMSNIGINSVKRSDYMSDDTQFTLVSKAMADLYDSNLYLDDSGGLSLAQINSRVRMQKIKHGKVDGIFVDYLQLITGSGRSKTEEIGSNVLGLKNLAKEMNCPIIVLSQMNRSGIGEPKISELFGASAIEQTADWIMLIHRDEYGKENEDGMLAKIISGKVRMGEVGSDVLESHLSRSKFVSTDRPVPIVEQNEPRKYST
ncbi:MAG: replicative DNA helicase [Psychromonas sp.]|jgi:replicative DNA helicase